MRRIKAEGRDPTVSSLARRLSESRQENNYAERMRLAFEMTRKDAND